MSALDRKRLWGKAANRCALCNTPLTRPETTHDAETVIGEEAHIVGRRPGAARYRPLSESQRDAYPNRILLCPTHHAVIDGQPGVWNEERLLERKLRHEGIMAARTDHGEHNGLFLERPAEVRLPLLLSGGRLLEVVGGALVYDTGQEDLACDQERTVAAELLQSALDWGEIHGDLGPAGRTDAEDHLSELLVAAVEAGLLVYGARLETTVRFGDERHRWPVAYLRVRRAGNVAAEQRAAGARA